MALRILQLTDMHILPQPGDTLLDIDTSDTLQRVLQDSLQHGPYDLILLTGDLTQIPNTDSYLRILKILQSYKTPCLCLPGNHDDAAIMRKILNRDPVSSAKQINVKNWQILCLDSQIPGSQAGRVSDRELDFLRRKLNSSTAIPTLIAVHHHCVKSNSLWMDTMIIENRESFFEIIDRHPQVKAVIFGHIHQVLETKHRSVSIMGSPATCFQFKPGCQKFALDNKPPGYRILNLYPDGSLDSEVFWLSIQPANLNFGSHSY